MKIREGFELREVCGMYVLVASGRKNIDFSKVVSMNESAAEIWKAVADREFTVEYMAKALTDNYEVDAETALKDATAIAKTWRESQLVED